jgi:hypothetical protein
MEAKDVKVGMKVIPSAKTIGVTYKTMDAFYRENPKLDTAMREHGFLTVYKVDNDGMSAQLSDANGNGQQWFSSSDLTEAQIEVGDTVRVVKCMCGGHGTGTQGVVFESNYGGAQYGVIVKGDKKWHMPEELDLVRKAKKPAEPEKPADRRPTVGDWVEVVEDTWCFRAGYKAVIETDDHTVGAPYELRSKDGVLHFVSACRVKLTTPPEQKPEPTRLALVKHDNRDKLYLFEVPANASVAVGDCVVCDTYRGKQQGTVTCVGMARDETMPVLLMLSKATHPLRKIVGKVETIEVKRTETREVLF